MKFVHHKYLIKHSHHRQNSFWELWKLVYFLMNFMICANGAWFGTLKIHWRTRRQFCFKNRTSFVGMIFWSSKHDAARCPNMPSNWGCVPATKRCKTLAILVFLPTRSRSTNASLQTCPQRRNLKNCYKTCHDLIFPERLATVKQSALRRESYDSFTAKSL